MKTVASRMESLVAHYFAALGPRIAAMQAAGCDVIRLDEGSPDLPPAPHIVDALAQAARLSDRHGYQPHRGPQALREAWAEMYFREWGVNLDVQKEIQPLLGSKEGIFHLMQALIEPGDIVLVPDPGYVTYTRGARFAGGEPFYVPLLPEHDYLPDLDAVPPEAAARAKILWLNYPNNPTAAVASLEFFAEAVAFARRYNLLVCHDAAYTQVTFDGRRAPSLLEAPGAKEVGLEFNTLSKSHNMAGWRVGAALGSAEAVKALFTLKTNADSSHFLPILEAAVAAMIGDQAWLRERNEVYRQRRDLVVAALNKMGLVAAEPRASLYVWSQVPDGWTSAAFVEAVLEGANLSLTPGTLFGERGEGFFRLSFTAPLERIAEAMDRLGELMPQLMEGKGR